MRARVRDFIYTKDDLFLATTTYLHPNDRIQSFLRYIPDPDGERSLNGSRYTKVDSQQAYNFLEEYYPDYLFDCQVTQVKMMGAPTNRVERILSPVDRLKEIMEMDSPNDLLLKVIKVAETFREEAGIGANHLGISGSILPNL